MRSASFALSLQAQRIGGLAQRPLAAILFYRELPMTPTARVDKPALRRLFLTPT
jgi:hypothetical protein